MRRFLLGKVSGERRRLLVSDLPFARGWFSKSAQFPDISSISLPVCASICQVLSDSCELLAQFQRVAGVKYAPSQLVRALEVVFDRLPEKGRWPAIGRRFVLEWCKLRKLCAPSDILTAQPAAG